MSGVAIFLYTLDVSDHFVDDAEHTDHVRYFMRETNGRARDVSVNVAPLSSCGQKNAEHGCGFGYQQHRFRVRKQPFTEGDILEQIRSVTEHVAVLRASG